MLRQEPSFKESGLTYSNSRLFWEENLKCLSIQNPNIQRIVQEDYIVIVPSKRN